MQNKWYVLTGGPSVGKTTLLEFLKQEGHLVFPEAARVIIDDGMAKGLAVSQIRKDEKQFQIDVMRHKQNVEAKHDPKVLTFFDRGMHDTLAYLKAYSMEIDAEIEKAVNASMYRKVFLLDALPSYMQDYARTEDENFRERITDLLHAVYTDAGMEVMRVPVLSPKKRADFVLNAL